VLARWAGALARHPVLLTSEVLRWSSDELQVLTGLPVVDPEPGDRRFDDPAWDGRLWSRVAHSFLVTRAGLLRSVDHLRLDPVESDRAAFFLALLTDAVSPSNSLLSNPVALSRAWHTRGRSVVKGARNLVRDLRHNGGMPSQVNTEPFRVGETIAVTPGAVVHRNDLFELIQYAPQTAEVCSLPLVIIPPQINRYYFLDLAPGRSFAEHCVQQGVPTYMISWRNPQPEHRHWSANHYAEACLEAVTIAADIQGAEQANTIGFCGGGMTGLALLSHLNQTGGKAINAGGMAVSLVDVEVPGSLHAFMGESTQRLSLAASRRRGVLDAQSLSKLFAWVRANDLVWNYWVSNYLLGETPPAFDVLAWNADGTNMSAGLHADFLALWKSNGFMNPGSLEVLGSPLDPSAVKNDLYVVGAVSDHLVPWQSAYAATQIVGGNARFVLSRSGHIQALVNPPGNPKASFLLNPDNPADPQDWMSGATTVKQSWWVDWVDWLLERSGASRPAPQELGTDRHPVLEPAPGRYVRER
jgi:polyhydroxyalkanoate synthase subunit PhaC